MVVFYNKKNDLKIARLNIIDEDERLWIAEKQKWCDENFKKFLFVFNSSAFEYSSF